MEFIFGIFIMTFMIGGGIWQRNNEKRWWHGGFCREHYTLWKQFDTDSQGGRGYRCGQGCHTWISYKVDQY